MNTVIAIAITSIIEPIRPKVDPMMVAVFPPVKNRGNVAVFGSAVYTMSISFLLTETGVQCVQE